MKKGGIRRKSCFASQTMTFGVRFEVFLMKKSCLLRVFGTRFCAVCEFSQKKCDFFKKSFSTNLPLKKRLGISFERKNMQNKFKNVLTPAADLIGFPSRRNTG